jgi:methionyl-tRNA formyltransferase
VPLVVTQPDKAIGRKAEIQAPPVKRIAHSYGIPVVQPEKIRHNEEFRTQLEAIRPDAIIVVAYGRIIPKWMLDLPPLGNINLHASLLPKYRGAAPIQWAVANGETTTGVTTMRIDEGLDTGPLLLAEIQWIAPEETAIDVFECLADVGARLMVKTMSCLECGSVTAIEQNHAEATHAPILKREDGLIDFYRTARQVYNRWRGFQPWPGAYSTLRGKKLIAHAMKLATGIHGNPGELILDRDRMFAACAEGSAIELLEVQAEGKRRMTAAEFLRGYQLRSGERLGA